MSVGLVGRKCGMTRIFRENGDSIPVTVIEALPNRVTTVKTAERDGYRAVQVTVGGGAEGAPDDEGRSRAISRTRRSIRVAGSTSFGSAKARAPSSPPAPSSRSICSKSASSSTSAARRRARATRASSSATISPTNTCRTATRCRIVRRAPSVNGKRRAACSPASAWPAAWAPTRSRQINLEVIKVDAERNLLLVKGAVPGSENGQVVVRPAVKAAAAAKAAK